MAGNKSNKPVQAIVKLQIEAGKANPAPPIGPALGQHGVQIMDFCKAYNDATKDKAGTVIPVEITIYTDRTFSFILKTPPTTVLIKKALGIKKGASTPNTETVGVLTKSQLQDIANEKMADLNANDIDAAMKIIEGTARNMGVKVRS